MREEERFNKRVVKGPEESSCWVWTGALGDDGYGRFWVKDRATGREKIYRAHRYALQKALNLSDENLENLHVLHRCDNPLCVHASSSPSSHLYLGSREENMQDRASRGRHFMHGNRKAHEQKARELRDAIKAKGYNQELINQFVLALHPDQQTLF